MKSMSRGYQTGVVVLALCASMLVPAPAGASADLPEGRYVALGDSYSSGKGVSPYDGVGGEPDPCYRSYGSYPRLLVDSLSVDGFEFWACSGAHVNHVATRRVSQDEPPYDDPADVPPGTAYRSALDRLDRDVSLVTITIGGHDAGFGDVMFDCVQPFWLGACDDLDDEVQADLARLPGKLAPLYRSIRARIHPNGRVLVLGYPQLFPDDPGGICVDGGFINSGERRWLNDVAVQLNEVIANSVAAADGVEFVPVREAFRGHEICGSSEAYLVGASIRHPSNSFHPNYKGHRALADVVRHHIATVPSPVAPAPPAPPPPPLPLPPPPEPEPRPTDLVGGFDDASGLWALTRADGTTNAFFYGVPGDVPLIGDWDCDGVESVGMYRPSTGFVYLRNRNTFGVAEVDFYYGIPGDRPIAGDWDGDGCDTLAIFRPTEGRVYVSNRLGTHPADFSFAYGSSDDVPFAGDFDGDGADSIGFARAAGLTVFRNTLSSGPHEYATYHLPAGQAVVAGDWDGDGTDTPAVRNPGGTFQLWNRWIMGPADAEVQLGERYRLPVAGRTS